MAREAAAIIGSGTLPFTSEILADTERGVRSSTEVVQNTAGRGGLRTGTQVMVGNPEDINSAEAFAVSGITVGTTPVQIYAPGKAMLPRMREIVIQNTGGQNVLIGPSAEKASIAEGFQLATGGTAGTNRRITLPLMHNVEIWARAQTGTSTIKMLMY